MPHSQRQPHHIEHHTAGRNGWLRAAVLGANDGIVSTASLILGVMAAGAAHAQIVVAGAAGLVAGAMSMAAGEYVSVSSQRDSERADLERERYEHARDAQHEHAELAAIYRRRGLDDALAQRVAAQLMAHDALGAHALDELGINDLGRARPLQAALVSALSFAVGAALPLLIVVLLPGVVSVLPVALCSLLCLALLGALAARVGGASLTTGALRVTLWGAVAMLVTIVIGSLFG